MQDILLYTQLVFFELLITLGLTCYLIHYYSAKNVPFYVKAVACVSWYSSFSVICLLPYDIYLVSIFDFVSSIFGAWTRIK